MQYSTPEYNSADQPFFMQNPTDEPDLEKKVLTKEKIDEYTKRYIVSKNSYGKGIDNNNSVFPDSLKTFFVGKPYTCEIYINEWTIMSMQNMIERFESVYPDNILALDIGFKYMGMGHVKVLFYDPVNKCYFFRHDGGSSGYDREYHYDILKKYKYDGNIKFGFSFEDLFKQINGENEEKPVLF